jgi:hypothetical protein
MPTDQRHEGPSGRARRTGIDPVAARWAVLAPTVGARSTKVFKPDQCANCLDPLPIDELGLFCSDWCAETAKTVRYMRGAISEDRPAKDLEVAHAFMVRVDFLYTGGYNRLERTPPAKTRAAVVANAGGVCVQCGAPAREVDHIAGSSNELSNLQLLCADCHREKTDASLGTALATDEEDGVPWFETLEPVQQALLVRRVDPDVPRLLCDDHQAWDTTWRNLKSERRERVKPYTPQQARARARRAPLVFESVPIPDESDED